MDSLSAISESLILAVKKGEKIDQKFNKLKNLEFGKLLELNTDSLKKAFWINIYNAYFQILRKVDGIESSRIFTDKLINIGGVNWSLDDIEHGILRRYRYKFSLGLFKNPFASKRIKQLAVKKLDYRIHFALNCGAKSCPPIAFYSSDKVELQLELATQSFLESDTDIKEEKKEIYISRLIQFYWGDFFKAGGIRKILKEKLNLDTKGYQLKYKPYHWDELLDNYGEGF